jgi:hypothetical protein
MWTIYNVRFAKATLLLLISSAFCPSLSNAQAAKPNLDTYIAQSVREAGTLYGVTIAEWSAHHPSEVAQAPDDVGGDDPTKAYELNPRQQNDRSLEGRWCLRSVTETDLSDGIHVRRTALFYQPIVELTYGKPLPTLPAETGEALRYRGCKLVRILHEFDRASDSKALLETIAAQLPGERSEEPGKFVLPARDLYWKPVYSFNKFGQPLTYHYLFSHNPKTSKDDDAPAVLLEWRWGTLDYGQPSEKLINPLASQPWLEMRAAVLAGVPKDATLQMLSFLAPRIGDYYEQPPFYCEKQLIPVLRKWLDLAAHSKPQEQAAAILLADRVLLRLDSCAEFSNSGELSTEQQDLAQKDYAALKKDLQELGVETEMPARIGNEYYTGNLMEKVLKLAPDGPVNELAHLAILDNRCQWSSNSESADCAKIIQEGETFLARFPEDEWTPSVHLILAEAYALMAANPEDEVSATPQPSKSEWEQKAAVQYRAWYAKGMNQRDRPLVWQEIWGLDAGLGPWLLMPFQRE